MLGHAARLFQPIAIGHVELKNRVGMAPMSVFGMVSTDGCFTQRGIDYYVERAKGGAGLIITGYSEIENDVEVSLPGVAPNPSVSEPRFICTASEMAERIHAYGAKVFLQITLGLGRVGYRPWISCTPIAPSPIPSFWDLEETCRAVSVDEIASLVQASAKAARTAKLAGFDGVEVHAAHEGYLLDQFAMAMFNKRTDRYGGDLEHRLAFATEVVKEIKATVGPEFPVIMRYSVKSFIKDWRKGGLPGESFAERGRDLDEGLEAARILADAGYDALDADCGSYEGSYWAHPPGYQEHGCYLPYVARLKEAVAIPILMSGRMEIPELAERALTEGQIDVVMLGRGLLADPYWPQKVRAGRTERIRPCLGCHDGCLGREDSCRPISCAVNPTCGREAAYALQPALEPKKVLVVGGGVAGMEAARVAALRGHQVRLFERTKELGGHVVEGSVPDFKRDERRLIAWYQAELAQAGVDVRLGEEATAGAAEAVEPDVVVLATGSKAKVPGIPGIDGDQVVTATDVLLDPACVGGDVVVLGGGLVGCEVALWLAQQQKRVTVLEVMDELMSAVDVPFPNRHMLFDLLAAHQVGVITSTTVTEVTAEGVRVAGADGEERAIVADTVVVAAGYEPVGDARESWAASAPEVYVIGDAAEARNIMAAIWDAYEVARSI